MKITPQLTRGGADRLKLIRSKKNSGGLVGIPRNIAINLSMGKYLFFMDSDDAMMPNALEILFNYAEKFNVDVVHCEKYYKAPINTVTTNKNLLKEHSDEKVDFVNKPTLMSDNLEDRVRDFGTYKIIGYPWNKLIRRDMMAKNDIKFPLLRCGDDHVFSFHVICFAKNMLRIPEPVYVWRINEEGVTHNRKLSPEKLVHRWVDSTFRGIGLMDKLMDEFDLFHKKPQYRHLVFETVINYHFSHALPLYAQIPAYQLDSLIRRELEEVEDKTALTAFLFARMNIFNLQLNQQGAIIQQMNAHIQKQNQIIQQLQGK